MDTPIHSVKLEYLYEIVIDGEGFYPKTYHIILLQNSFDSREQLFSLQFVETLREGFPGIDISMQNQRVCSVKKIAVGD